MAAHTFDANEFPSLCARIMRGVPSISRQHVVPMEGGFTYKIWIGDHGPYLLRLAIADDMLHVEVGVLGWWSPTVPSVMSQWPACHPLPVQHDHVDRIVREFLAGVEG